MRRTVPFENGRAEGDQTLVSALFRIDSAEV